jgi:DnaK suppressor protein
MTATAHTGAAALPVRPGEKRWTEAELDAVRSELASEASVLRADIERAESDIASRLGDAVGDAGDDQADVGAKTFEREHELALTHNSRELLAQNERALSRIETGTYGTCESCGEPIGKARLQAFPRATLCVTCKQREERR